MDGLTWEVFDIMGTVAFAVSGAVVGIEKRMDIFGIIVLALLTAVGGGIVRDVLAGITPPTALCHVTDFMLSIVTAVIISTVYALLPLSRKRRHRILQVYNFCDTVGLASFTVTGMLTGLASGTANPYLFPVLLGVITAVGGGILRDLMAQRMPAVLYKDIYATASLMGALVACIVSSAIGLSGMAWLCFLLVLFLRWGALRFGWHLYHPRLGRLRQRDRQRRMPRS